MNSGGCIPALARRGSPGVVILGLDLGEGGVEGEVVARLLAAGLRAVEVVDRGAHLSADQHQNSFGAHLDTSKVWKSEFAFGLR